MDIQDPYFPTPQNPLPPMPPPDPIEEDLGGGAGDVSAGGDVGTDPVDDPIEVGGDDFMPIDPGGPGGDEPAGDGGGVESEEDLGGPRRNRNGLPGEPPTGLEGDPGLPPSTGLPLAMPGAQSGAGSFAQPGTQAAIPFQPPGFFANRSVGGDARSRLGPGSPMASAGSAGVPSALGGGDALGGLFNPSADDELLAMIMQGPGVRR